MIRSKKIIYNIVTGVGGKMVIIILSFIVPRLLLTNYGSEINGLFTTINNIYSYLAIIEAGIATSATQLLYRHVAENNKKEINNILYTTKKYFRNCGYIYGLGVVVLAIVLPVTFQTTINKGTIAIIVLIQGTASLLNFFIVAGLTSLLSAEGKDYITNSITLLTNIMTNLAKIFLVSLQVNIIILQVAYFGISVFSTVLYYVYFSKEYKWINRKKGDDKLKLPQRGYFLMHNVFFLIFNNTDTILLSLFCGLKVTSVYAVYNMIFSNILGMVNTLFNSIKYKLGQTYNKNRERYVLLHDTYKSYYCCFVFSVITVAYYLITPFMKLYTSGVSDIDYIDPYLPLLFSLVNLLSSCRTTETNLINLAFFAKQTFVRAIIESVLNLGTSIVLIQILGIYGCLIGTIIALLYRTNDFLFYANIKILNRKPLQAYLTVVVDFGLFFLLAFVKKYINFHIDNYIDFCLYGVLFLSISIFIYFWANSITCIKGYKLLIRLIRK